VLATAEEQEELGAAQEDETGGGEGPSNPADPGAGARWDGEQAERKKQEAAAAAEEVEVEDLSQQFSDVLSPSKPPAPKKPKKGGDGGSSSQAVELTGDTPNPEPLSLC